MITSYLLGDLSETESAQLEDSSFFNPERLEELRSVEDDLIDQYARGELPSREKEKFERFFFANPERRQRVEFALALARISSNQVSNSSIIAREGSRTFRDFFGSLLRVPRPVLIYSTAILAVALLIGIWWFSITTNSPNEIVRRPAPGQEQVTPGKGPPGQSPAATQSEPPEIAREGAAPPASNKRGLHDNRNAGRGVSHAEPAVATFILLPGMSRSGDERTKLVVPHGRQVIRLKLTLEEHDAARFKNFRAELRQGNSEKTLVSRILSAQRNRTLQLDIPPSRLPAQTADYELTLRGRAPHDRAFETVGYYYLTIVKE